MKPGDHSGRKHTISAEIICDLSRQIMTLFGSDTSRETLMEETIVMIQKKTDFESVGIRLRDGLDFPYYFTSGFSPDFVKAEMSLCSKDQDGEIIRDSDGNPYVECMCGNIVTGRTDTSLPFFTVGGSFWSNCTTELLANSTDEDRQTRTRNRCNGEGYESVALIPIKENDKIFGLLQFNDRRKDCFTIELIEFLEGVAGSVAMMFSMRKAKEQLHLRAGDLVRQTNVRARLLERIANDLATSKSCSKGDVPSGNIASQVKKLMEEMETLKGIIPICSSCKKVRTDEGYWEQIESYVSQSSEADFSHSYCPQCYEKIMKELNGDSA